MAFSEYKSNLFDPMKLGFEKSSEIHGALLKHKINLYMLFMAKNSPTSPAPASSPSLLVLRPATHSEARMVDENYENISKCQFFQDSELEQIPCPCIILVNEKILTVGFHPIFLFCPDCWKDSFPNFKDWMNMKDNQNTCEVCGSNILFNNTQFCCDIHKIASSEVDLDQLKELCDFRDGIIL